jgi:hypothetical protein
VGFGAALTHLSFLGLKIEAARFFEALVCTGEYTWHQNPKDNNNNPLFTFFAFWCSLLS